MEGDYLELSQFPYNSHPFPYDSHQYPLGTTGFLTPSSSSSSLPLSHGLVFYVLSPSTMEIKGEFKKQVKLLLLFYV